MCHDDASLINGDVPLSPTQRVAYMQFHRRRNRENAGAARSAGIRTLPLPSSRPPSDPGSTPARVATLKFFEFAAKVVARRFAHRDVVILDVGCGSGRQLAHFERAGLRGTYLGLDVVRHKAWSDQPTPHFRRRLITGDVHAFAPGSLPAVDLLVSSTALEHIADDRAVLTRLRARLSPAALEIHVVPGEASLEVYGPHGWRQYSPACLRALFPTGDIYRLDGSLSRVVQQRATSPAWDPARPSLAKQRPALYRTLRDVALGVDRLLGNRSPTMYGVIAKYSEGAHALPVRGPSRAAA